MRNLADCESLIEALQYKIQVLEQEIETKDELQCAELRLMQEHIEALMNKYCLN